MKLAMHMLLDVFEIWGGVSRKLKNAAFHTKKKSGWCTLFSLSDLLLYRSARKHDFKVFKTIIINSNTTSSLSSLPVVTWLVKERHGEYKFDQFKRNSIPQKQTTPVPPTACSQSTREKKSRNSYHPHEEKMKKKATSLLT